MWKTGTEKLELGQYKLTGTVKEHSEYKGELQTVMTRCKAVRTDAQIVAA
jgi:exo-beta-1,3-glucanase (GH17 family)